MTARRFKRDALIIFKTGKMKKLLSVVKQAVEKAGKSKRN
jgi:hypothetical protein